MELTTKEYCEQMDKELDVLSCNAMIKFINNVPISDLTMWTPEGEKLRKEIQVELIALIERIEERKSLIL